MWGGGRADARPKCSHGGRGGGRAGLNSVPSSPHLLVSFPLFFFLPCPRTDVRRTAPSVLTPPPPGFFLSPPFTPSFSPFEASMEVVALGLVAAGSLGIASHLRRPPSNGSGGPIALPRRLGARQKTVGRQAPQPKANDLFDVVDEGLQEQFAKQTIPALKTASAMANRINSMTTRHNTWSNRQTLGLACRLRVGRPPDNPSSGRSPLCTRA